MSEARSLINYIGNGVTSLAISRWEKELSVHHLNQAMEANSINEGVDKDFIPIKLT